MPDDSVTAHHADPTDAEAPAEQVEVSVEEAPADETPADETPAEETPAEETPAEEAAPLIADEVLLAAADLARSALAEITPESTIGEPVGHIVEGDRVLSLLFENRMGGYPGWHWTVSIARVDEAEPTVLEAELMPGERALLAPDWVPWSERLADYRAAQEAAAAAALESDDDDADDEDFDDEDFDDDLDVDVFGDDSVHDEDDESDDEESGDDADEDSDDEDDSDDDDSDDEDGPRG